MPVDVFVYFSKNLRTNKTKPTTKFILKNRMIFADMKKSLIFSFSLIGQIGFATAIPLIIFGLLGRCLDKQFSTAPWLFLFGLMLATVQIYFYLRSIVRKASENIKDI